MSFDAMSIKKMCSYDRKLGRVIGFVDYGGECTDDQSGVEANEALVVMAVGLRNHWKIPLAYFNINGLKGDILAGIVRESLVRCHESGVTARTTVMDGTIHNINCFDTLGCKMQPKDTNDMVTHFPHPVTGQKVFAFMDPSHMIKNTREASIYDTSKKARGFCP